MTTKKVFVLMTLPPNDPAGVEVHQSRAGAEASLCKLAAREWSWDLTNTPAPTTPDECAHYLTTDANYLVAEVIEANIRAGQGIDEPINLETTT